MVALALSLTFLLAVDLCASSSTRKKLKSSIPSNSVDLMEVDSESMINIDDGLSEIWKKAHQDTETLIVDLFNLFPKLSSPQRVEFQDSILKYKGYVEMEMQSAKSMRKEEKVMAALAEIANSQLLNKGRPAIFMLDLKLVRFFPWKLVGKFQKMAAFAKDVQTLVKQILSHDDPAFHPSLLRQISAILDLTGMKSTTISQCLFGMRVGLGRGKGNLIKVESKKKKKKDKEMNNDEASEADRLSQILEYVEEEANALADGQKSVLMDKLVKAAKLKDLDAAFTTVAKTLSMEGLERFIILSASLLSRFRLDTNILHIFPLETKIRLYKMILTDIYMAPVYLGMFPPHMPHHEEIDKVILKRHFGAKALIERISVRSLIGQYHPWFTMNLMLHCSSRFFLQISPENIYLIPGLDITRLSEFISHMSPEMLPLFPFAIKENAARAITTKQIEKILNGYGSIKLADLNDAATKALQLSSLLSDIRRGIFHLLREEQWRFLGALFSSLLKLSDEPKVACFLVMNDAQLTLEQQKMLESKIPYDVRFDLITGPLSPLQFSNPSLKITNIYEQEW